MNDSEIKHLIENEKEWRIYLLKQLDNVISKQNTIEKNQIELTTRFNLKSGLWGTLGGIIATVSIIFLSFVSNIVKKGVF